MTHLKDDPKTVAEHAEQLGYTAFGPIILRFSAWLALEAKGRGIRRLYFLSREGYFLLDLYKKCLAVQLAQAEEIEARYLLISRRAAFGASEKSRSTLEAMLMCGPFEGPLYDLLSARIGLSADTCARLGLANRTIDIQDGVGDILDQLEPVLPQLNELASAERGPLLKYLQQEDFLKDGEVALVDVGYSASIQRWLGPLAGRKLSGFYFATTRAVNEWENGQNKVYACFAKDCRWSKMPPVYRYALASESWLTAPAGQLLRFTDQNGVAMPQFGPEGETQRSFHVAAAVAKGVERYIEDIAFLSKFDPGWESTLAAHAQDILAAAMEAEMYGDVFEALSVEDAFCGNGEISLSQRVADLKSTLRLSDVDLDDDGEDS